MTALAKDERQISLENALKMMQRALSILDEHDELLAAAHLERAIHTLTSSAP